MKEKFRTWAWRALGINYYKFLKHKKHIHLKEANWVSIGKRTYDNGAYVWRWSKNSKLEIGKYCSIANDVHFICDSGYHNESEITTFPLFHEILSKKDSIIIKGKSFTVEEIKEKLNPSKSGILIGNDVWIGASTTILPGVKVGNGVTILAGSIVSKDIPDYAVVGGIPAEVVRMKHSNEIIQKLNEIAWWNWEDVKIKERVNDFYIPLDDFVKKYS